MSRYIIPLASLGLMALVLFVASALQPTDGIGFASVDMDDERSSEFAWSHPGDATRRH